jgi:hypothetical protein
MFMELTVSDSNRGNSRWVQLDLDFESKQWSVEEGSAFRHIAFANTGYFEIKPSGEMWLCDHNTRLENNTLIIQKAPQSEADSLWLVRSRSGQGLIKEPINPRFTNGQISWNIPSLAAIRWRILDLCRGILPPVGKFLTPGQDPMTRISAATHPGIPGETNCYAFPGWIAKQLGSTATAMIFDWLPDPKAGGALKKQKVTLSLSKGILLLEKFARDPAIDAWVPFTGKNRPQPGDFYVLLSDAKKPDIAHVGVIIDAVGDVWRTADSGQGPAGPLIDPHDNPVTGKRKYAGGFSAGYRDRLFDDGKLTGEHGNAAYLNGWVDIDNPVLVPAWATPKKL